MLKKWTVSLLWILMASLSGSFAVADDPAKAATKIELADGKIVLTAPEEWVKGQPRSNIVQYEFSAPKGIDDKEKTARITIMAAGGGIESNLDRWYGQVEQPDGSSTKDKSKLEKFEAAGQTVHFVSIPGTFKETMGGPFQNKPPVLKTNYMMLGAIVETKGMGTHFIKITGPADTVGKLTDGFRKMLKEMTVAK